MPTKPKTNYKPGPKDLCQTPEYALWPLENALISLNDRLYPNSEYDLKIWEPACGEGYLSTKLIDCLYDVVETDIKTGIDFLTYDPDFQYDLIITNPPFSLKYKFLQRCYELGKPFALLMPVDVLGAAKGQKLFKKYGGTVVLLDKRINFKMPIMEWDGGGSQFPVAWFTKGIFDDGENYSIVFYEYGESLTLERRKTMEY